MELILAGLCSLVSLLFWSDSVEPDSRIALNKEQQRTVLEMYHRSRAGSRRYDLLEEMVLQGAIHLPPGGPDRTLSGIIEKLGVKYKLRYE